jgi:hydrogenase maturation factor
VEEGQVGEVFRDIRRACAALEVTLVGGHTEVSFGLERPIICGAMLGEAPKDRLVTPEGARPKDALVLTKGVPLEAVAILARELRGELQGRFGKPLLDEATKFLYDPGISVVRDAKVAMEAVSVHALHDPTEGGLATAVHELAEASNLGAVIEAEKVPVLEAGRLFCDHLGLDPLGAFASGALLIALAPGDVPALLAALHAHGIAAAAIGEMREKGEGVRLRKGGKLQDLPLFTQDEIGKVL